ncbi:hypothetical protein HPB49_023897 [Dermacentor silvarum]|uniref:Uncharacterized protein n=1 Tax=Dermacentor silvarum TaxID=543639 RepID=A0ACB8E3K9_DERSI|nr:hypothetical protein HPB49_023897 [Dermacentor silvarum]
MANAGTLRGGYGGSAIGVSEESALGSEEATLDVATLLAAVGGYYGGGPGRQQAEAVQLRLCRSGSGRVQLSPGGGGDGSGSVQGEYTLSTAEGGQRKVKYTADAGGFRAVVDTNEPGTQSESPADVALRSSSPPAYLLASKYGPPGRTPGPDLELCKGVAGGLYGGVLPDTGMPALRRSRPRCRSVPGGVGVLGKHGGGWH